MKDIPTHIAIIMDGNGRWAKNKNLPRSFGHKKGANSVREVIEQAAEIGVKYLTLFAFSSENWKRPIEEVNDLMDLLRYYLDKEVENLIQNGFKLKIIGEREKLPGDILAKIEEVEARTKLNNGLCLCIALNYGARQEIISAAKKYAEYLALAKDFKLNEENFREFLYAGDVPDPDLLIRTSGELRISNFLLWQLAYTELYFTDILWPDFGKKQLLDAILSYQNRNRRFGA